MVSASFPAGSTEAFSPDDGREPGTMPSSRKRHHFTQKKSCSVDCEDMLGAPCHNVRSDSAANYSSMPALCRPELHVQPRATGSHQNSPTDAAVPDDPIGEDAQVDAFKTRTLSNAFVNNFSPVSNAQAVPLNSLKNTSKLMNYSDSKLTHIPNKCRYRDNSAEFMGGSLGVLSMNASDEKCPDSGVLKSPGENHKSDQSLLRSLQRGGRVSPTTPEIHRVNPNKPEMHRTEVRLTDSIPKVVLKQESYDEEEEDTREAKI